MMDVFVNTEIYLIQSRPKSRFLPNLLSISIHQTRSGHKISEYHSLATFTRNPPSPGTLSGNETKVLLSLYSSMKWKVLISLGLVVFVYLALGAITFYYLEGESEKEHHIFLENITSQFLEDNGCVSEAELDGLLRTILIAYDRGVIEFSNKSSASNWDLASSLFFSITVVTTIGYGHIYPATVGGQAFCVVYAILGIPLSLTLLAGIGHKLRQLFHVIDNKLNVCGTYPKLGKVFRAIFILLTGLICFLFLPGIMFVMVDRWTYAEALYYCFITLTTIGFGDLVPGLEDTDRNRSFYRVMVGLWIFVGLAWVAGVISFVQELFMTLVQRAQMNLEKHNGSSLGKSDTKLALDERNLDGTGTNSNADETTSSHSVYTCQRDELTNKNTICELDEGESSTNI